MEICYLIIFDNSLFDLRSAVDLLKQLKDKLPTMSEKEQLKLLATDGMLVKRPLVIGEDFVLVGFKESEWSEKL